MPNYLNTNSALALCRLKIGVPDDSEFAWVNQGSASVDVTNGGIYLLCPAAAGNSIPVRKKVAPATPWTLTIAFIPFVYPADYNNAGMVLRESSTGKLITYSLIHSAGANYFVARWDSPTSFNANANTLAIATIRNLAGSDVHWLQVSDDGTNLKYRYLNDGIHARQQLSESRTAFLAGGANEIGFFAHSSNASNDAGIWLLNWTVS